MIETSVKVTIERCRARTVGEKVKCLKWKAEIQSFFNCLSCIASYSGCERVAMATRLLALETTFYSSIKMNRNMFSSRKSRENIRMGRPIRGYTRPPTWPKQLYEADGLLEDIEFNNKS